MQKDFKIKVANFPLPEDETRQLLWKCFDILLANSIENKKTKKKINYKNCLHKGRAVDDVSA
jgi:hypothetical protein